MKLLSLIAFFICFLTISLNSQESDVPEVVEKSFKRKFPNAQNVSWDKVEGNYKADCYFRNRATYAEFTPEGEWVLTVTSRDPKTLSRPIQDYLAANFAKDKILFAEEAVSADKKDYFYVQLQRKDKNQKEPYNIELFFDKTGRIEQVKFPEGMNDMTIVGIDDPHSDIPAVVIDAWKKRFPRAEDIEWVTRPGKQVASDLIYLSVFTFREKKTEAKFQSDGTWIETRVHYPEKELHKQVVTYLYDNHKNDVLVLAEVVTNADKEDYTYVRMQQFEKGQTRPYNFELYFNKSGQIEKVIRPDVLRNEYLLTVDIPKEVARRFTSRFSGAKDVKWETSDNNWIAKFNYREEQTTATFSDSAQWIETVTQLDVKNLYSPIQRFIDQNHSDYKVSYAEKIVRSDRNNTYYIELVSKKKNLEPQQISLYFDGSGRPK
jgi:hypothetical protein